MARSPEIPVRITADGRRFNSALKSAGVDADRFEAKLKSTGRAMRQFALVATVAGTGILASAKRAATAAKEIQNLSNIAGVGAESFQKLAAAGDTVGLSQEKLADIFKDVNDKFGDFMATGAGPLKDFFEQIAPRVGVTADQFARLSGPEALQLYVDSLEKAGVSQQQMTFYLEALASDTTALLPLLQNGGREMKRLGEEAEKAGRVISDKLIAEGASLDKKLTELSDKISTKAKKAILEYADEIERAADFIVDDLIPALASFGTAIAGFVQGLEPAIAAVQKFLSLAAAAAGVEPPGAGAGPSQEEQDDLAQLNEDSRKSNLETSRTGTHFLDEDGNLVEFGTPEAGKPVPGVTSPQVWTPINTKKKNSTSGGGGGSASDIATDYERMAEQWKTKLELMQEFQAEEMQILQDARDAGLIAEEEYQEKLRLLQEKHSKARIDIAKLEGAAKANAILGAGSDILGAMGAFNQKALKMAQVFGAAQALISTYQGQAEALKLPFPANLKAAAAIGAKGLALVGAIKSVSPGGGGGGGAAGGGFTGGEAAAAPAPQPLEVRLAGVSADQLYSGKMLSGLFDELQKHAGDRGYVLGVAS